MHTFWMELQTKGCPGPRAAHSCDVIDGRLYVFGGWNGKRALNDLHMLDVASNSWTEVHPNGQAPSARNNHTTAVVDLRLVVHGGHDGNKWVADMHILDTGGSTGAGGVQEGPTWHKAPTSGAPPSARACHTLTRLAHKLYMFGGYDGAKCFNDMDIIDLETMTWMQPALSGTLPQARNAHTMTVILTKLFLFGGHSGNKHLTDLHVFDTQKLQWSQPEILGTPPPGLRGHTANLIGHKIFLFGGYDGKGRTNELYVLDTAEGKWVRPTWPTESPHTPPGRQRHSASLIGSKRIYIFGGFDGNKWLNDLHVLDVGRLEESALNDVAVHTLIENMRRLLNSPDFSDITFVVEGKRIYAHKAILVAQCEHFHAMFSGGRFAEASKSEIEIPNWSYTAFVAMLEWLYTGHTPRELSAAHLTEVLGLADHYTLDGLKHVCENVLVHSVEIENVCALLRHADQYMAEALKRYCLQFILKNFDQVAYSKGFDELSSNPALLLEVTRAAATKNTDGGGAHFSSQGNCGSGGSSLNQAPVHCGSGGMA
ncbi:unnamed protein product [Prorocentrum cordatum]|uniref:BTB domain-containing protein n=1 Tax=Prorocentrum cordatum TaxID=2364126 RepID=A0ABN9VQB9_9DINO|nr:unnamed protein product [Polarella glacialis]